MVPYLCLVKFIIKFSEHLFGIIMGALPLKGRSLYIALGLIVISLHYIIPYSILREASGFSLFIYWVSLAAAWIAITVIYLRRWVK